MDRQVCMEAVERAIGQSRGRGKKSSCESARLMERAGGARVRGQGGADAQGDEGFGQGWHEQLREDHRRRDEGAGLWTALGRHVLVVGK